MGRRFCIRRAVEHGATWERQWSTSVTHVIADSALTYQQVIDIQAIPENVVLVNENWPARCMASRGLVSPDDPMSRVERVAPAPNVDYGLGAERRGEGQIIADGSQRSRETTPASSPDIGHDNDVGHDTSSGVAEMRGLASLTEEQLALLFKVSGLSAQQRQKQFLLLDSSATFSGLASRLKDLDDIQSLAKVSKKLQKALTMGAGLPVDALISLSITSYMHEHGQLGVIRHGWNTSVGGAKSKALHRLIFAYRRWDSEGRTEYDAMAPRQRAGFLSWWSPTLWQDHQTCMVNVWTFHPESGCQESDGVVKVTFDIKAETIEEAKKYPDLMLLVLADCALLVPMQDVLSVTKRGSESIWKNQARNRLNGAPVMRVIYDNRKPDRIRLMWHYFPQSETCRAWGRRFAIPRDEGLEAALYLRLKDFVLEEQRSRGIDDDMLDFNRTYADLARGL